MNTARRRLQVDANAAHYRDAAQRREQARASDGKFGEQQHSEPEVGISPVAGKQLDAESKPFSAAGWLKMSDEEQRELVRPLLGEYRTARATLEAEGRIRGDVAYNDDFRGRMPGLAGATHEDEGTAIYLLQTLHRVDLEAKREQAFLAEGFERAEPLEGREDTRRGTIIHRSWYMGGTGWEEIPDARLIRMGDGSFGYIPKGKRTPRALRGGHILFKADGK